MESLHRNWDSTLLGLEAPATVVEEWWQTIQRQYGEGHRHYHTLDHILHLVSLMIDCSELIDNHTAILLAIIFHDIVYDPKAADNEEQSVQMFKLFASDAALKSSLVDEVCELIIKTKSHTTEAHTTPELCGSKDCHYFLDFDMTILGADQKDYDTYARQIRQEYIHVPEDVYRLKRSEVLKQFLQTQNLFATKELRSRFEKQARENITREIEWLNRHGDE